MESKGLFPGLDKPLRLLPQQEEASLTLLAGEPPPSPIRLSFLSLDERVDALSRWRTGAPRRAIERCQLLLICGVCDEPLIYVGEASDSDLGGIVFWFDCPRCEHVTYFKEGDSSVFTTLAEHLQRSRWDLVNLLR